MLAWPLDVVQPRQSVDDRLVVASVPLVLGLAHSSLAWEAMVLMVVVGRAAAVVVQASVCLVVSVWVVLSVVVGPPVVVDV